MSADFPLIYCNGDSYTDENYHPSLVGNTYAHEVGRYCHGFTINRAIKGSCNRRIVRTTVHDILQQRQLNPEQKIIALIGLSFELRSEIWIDELDNDKDPAESNLRTHTFSQQIGWREKFLSGLDIITTDNEYKVDEKFLKKFSEGRAFFYSPYQERINLLTDMIMLAALLDQHNVEFLIFQSPRAEKLESDYLLDFLRAQIALDPRFIDFETFGFVDWCCQQGFTPIDMLDQPGIAHYGPNAHRSFAREFLIPKLKQLNIL